MSLVPSARRPLRLGLTVGVVSALVACGGGGGDPAVQARPQSISFEATPSVTLVTVGGIARGAVQVAATASSGLAVRYSSVTPDVCTVDEQTGAVTVASQVGAHLEQGCTIAADQYGNDTYAPVRNTVHIGVALDPAQSVTFGAAPTLSLFSVATVVATASSGLPVRYRSDSPAICTVDPDSGVVTDLTAAGACQVSARQAGDSHFQAAEASLSMPVVVPEGITVPGQPTGVAVTLGDDTHSVVVSVGATDSGGTPITGYKITSVPAGVSATTTALPITVSCGGACNGRAFRVVATNAVGDSVASDAADVLTDYNVVTTFYEPATQPNDTIFTGTFTFNATLGTVSKLQGTLTESMTGGSNSLSGGASSTGGHYGDVPMTLVTLNNQLKSQAVTLGGVQGWLVTTFARPTTDTFIVIDGGDGWSPDAGVDVGGVYFGYPKAKNPYDGGVGNAYAMVFINAADPVGDLKLADAPAQVNRLAYADCTAGGMMGAVCMTGTAVAGYGGTQSGSVGTMGGYPVRQVITRKR